VVREDVGVEKERERMYIAGAIDVEGSSIARLVTSTPTHTESFRWNPWE